MNGLPQTSEEMVTETSNPDYNTVLTSFFVKYKWSRLEERPPLSVFAKILVVHAIGSLVNLFLYMPSSRYFGFGNRNLRLL